jgi:hypothetical protein
MMIMFTKTNSFYNLNGLPHRNLFTVYRPLDIFRSVAPASPRVLLLRFAKLVHASRRLLFGRLEMGDVCPWQSICSASPPECLRGAMQGQVGWAQQKAKEMLRASCAAWDRDSGWSLFTWKKTTIPRVSSLFHNATQPKMLRRRRFALRKECTEADKGPNRGVRPATIHK